MKVLVIGGGGREHAICWKLKQSPKVKELFCAPGNAGISEIATCVPIKATSIEKIAEYAEKEKIDLVFVAPDDPLALGLVDLLQKKNIRAFGPKSNAAIVEASKVFSKELMKNNNIPTAKYETFDKAEDAIKYVSNQKTPIVVKADGLALGKGVIIANTNEEAIEAIKSIMEEKSFGDAGNKIVIEEFLSGPELTVLAFTDGKTVVPMISSRDHKRAYDNDKGKNTGGMGAITPGADLSDEQEKEMYDKIFVPTIEALDRDGRPFVGVIYFGLMLTENGPKVIEYNARFGDPEAQAILPRLKTDLIDIIDACIDGNLENIKIEWANGSSCCVVMASGGYPEKYETGFEIKGLSEVSSPVFHAGTKLQNGKTVTSGGRVLAVYTDGKTTEEAIENAYKELEKISFSGMHFRTDIGKTNWRKK